MPPRPRVLLPRVVVIVVLVIMVLGYIQIFGSVQVQKMRFGTQKVFGAFNMSSSSAEYADATLPVRYVTKRKGTVSSEEDGAVGVEATGGVHTWNATWPLGRGGSREGARANHSVAPASLGGGHDVGVQNASDGRTGRLPPLMSDEVFPAKLPVLDSGYVGAKTRWRGNMYVRDGGILPYALCGSDADVREPKVDLDYITTSSHRLGFTVLAATVWGESDETGKPTALKHLQVALYYQQMGKVCQKIPRNPYLHCILPAQNVPVVEFECRIGQGEWHRMWRRNDFQVANAMVAQDILHCNSTGGLNDLSDTFGVQIRVLARSNNPQQDLKALNESHTISFEVCYQHVERTWPLVICTEPMYGHKPTSGFWFNHQWQRNNSFSVLDEFVTYHIMQGARVQIHDHDGTLNTSMNRYRGNPAVAYRRGWSMPAINYPNDPPAQSTAYETHAETACMWEHRFRAKWVQILHSADNFAFASEPGVLISDVARKLATNNLSVILIPTCSATSSLTSVGSQAPRNIVEKYSLLASSDGVAKSRSRFTPIADPRAFDSCNVHWFTAPRASYKMELLPDFAVKVLCYYTVHLVAMSIRKGKNLDSHIGRTDAKWNWLGSMLKDELDKLPPA